MRAYRVPVRWGERLTLTAPHLSCVVTRGAERATPYRTTPSRVPLRRHPWQRRRCGRRRSRRAPVMVAQGGSDGGRVPPPSPRHHLPRLVSGACGARCSHRAPDAAAPGRRGCVRHPRPPRGPHSRGGHRVSSGPRRGYPPPRATPRRAGCRWHGPSPGHVPLRATPPRHRPLRGAALWRIESPRAPRRLVYTHPARPGTRGSCARSARRRFHRPHP